MVVVFVVIDVICGLQNRWKIMLDLQTDGEFTFPLPTSSSSFAGDARKGGGGAASGQTASAIEMRKRRLRSGCHIRKTRK